VPLGFDTAGVLSARIALPAQRYESDEAVAGSYRRILEELRAMPQMRHVGASTIIPLTGGQISAGIEIEGKPFAPGTGPSPEIRLVTDDYVEAIGMMVTRGRTLNASDMAPGAPPVVMINERLASLAWPGEDPIGKRLSAWTRDPGTPEWREVVGVIGDVRSFGPDTPAVPELFLPFTQPPLTAWAFFQRSMALVARTSGDPAASVSTVRSAVRSIDSSLPLFDVFTMDEALGRDGAGSRFTTWLFSLLAAVGLALATIGIYGVIAYFVTQRTAEIGLRLALGATPRLVLMMVVRRGALLAGVGVGIGLLGALATTRLVTTLLFEVTPTDLPTYAAGGIGLMAIALLACAVPAVRAVRISPVRSLAEF
jgi:predicted permease